MENIENDNKSINNLSKDAVDGKDLKGGGTPGWVEGGIDGLDTGDAGFLNPNDPMGGIHHANQLENPGGVMEANNNLDEPAGSAILNPLLSPSPTNNPSI